VAVEVVQVQSAPVPALVVVPHEARKVSVVAEDVSEMGGAVQLEVVEAEL
jgi:hypothetical protein